MLNEISQRKTNTIWFHLYVESIKQNKQNKTEQKHIHRHRGQTDGCHRDGGSGMSKIGEGD